MRACAQLLVKVCACRTKTLAKINCQNQSHATVHALSLACEKAASAAQTRQGRTQSRAALGHIQIQHRSGCAHLAHHTYKAGLGCHSVVVRSTKLGWTLFSTTHACALPLLFRSRIRFTRSAAGSRAPSGRAWSAPARGPAPHARPGMQPGVWRKARAHGGAPDPSADQLQHAPDTGGSAGHGGRARGGAGAAAPSAARRPARARERTA